MGILQNSMGIVMILWRWKFGACDSKRCLFYEFQRGDKETRFSLDFDKDGIWREKGVVGPLFLYILCFSLWHPPNRASFQSPTRWQPSFGDLIDLRSSAIFIVGSIFVGVTRVEWNFRGELGKFLPQLPLVILVLWCWVASRFKDAKVHSLGWVITFKCLSQGRFSLQGSNQGEVTSIEQEEGLEMQVIGLEGEVLSSSWTSDDLVTLAGVAMVLVAQEKHESG